MMKAYDRVGWNYLEGVLQKMGFAQCWINSVMRSVSPGRYIVKVNRELIDSFTPSRGLRQGDPLARISFFSMPRGYHA